jgi:hypothetical protein
MDEQMCFWDFHGCNVASCVCVSQRLWWVGGKSSLTHPSNGFRAPNAYRKEEEGGSTKGNFSFQK